MPPASAAGLHPVINHFARRNLTTQHAIARAADAAKQAVDLAINDAGITGVGVKLDGVVKAMCSVCTGNQHTLNRHVPGGIGSGGENGKRAVGIAGGRTV